MRPGWPTFNIQQPLHRGDPVEWLMKLWKGEDAKTFEMNTVSTGVVVSIPDYPYSHLTRKEVVGIPIYGIEDWDHTHPCECMMGTAPDTVAGQIVERPMMVTAGDYVLVMTGTGPDVATATRSTYRGLKTLSLPNSPMYRTDIGQRLRKQLPELQAMGYATAMEFSTPPQSLSA